jgi:type II secretory pathway component PulK
MLILTLWLSVVLGILATSLTSHLMMQTRLMSMRRHRMNAEALARAGIGKAVADLRNDLLLDSAEECEQCNFDAEGDIWKRPEEGKVDQELGNGTFTVQVVDEESRINLNNPQCNVELLTALLMQLGYEEEDAKIAAAAIVDWRDADDLCSIEGAKDRREGDVYALLRMGDDATDNPRGVEPAPVKNEFYSTVDELLYVYGVTPELFYGPGTAEAERARIEMADQFAYLNRRGHKFEIKKSRSRFRDEVPVGLRDCVTVYSNYTLNINTAGLEVLSALLRASGINTSDPETLAARIMEYRRDNREEDIDNNRAFRQVADLQALAEFGGDVGKMGSVYTLGVNSDNFTITSTGRAQQFSRTIQVVVNARLAVFQRSETFDDWRQERDRDRAYKPSTLRSDDSDLKSGRLGPDERTVFYPSVRVVQWLDP